jgi:hypothetical protein
MILNAAKTKTMLITTTQKRCRLPEPKLHIHMGESVLEQVAGETLIGVFIDGHLSWKVHVLNTHNKVNVKYTFMTSEESTASDF